MAKKFDFLIGTKGDTSGADDVEKSLREVEDAAGDVQKKTEAAFGEVAEGLGFSIADVKGHLAEVNDELERVEIGTEEFERLKKESKDLTRALDEVEKELGGVTSNLEGKLTAVNQSAEIVGKLRGNLDALGGILRERGLDEVAEKIEFVGVALQRTAEIAAVGIGAKLLIHQLGGLAAVLTSARAAALAFISSPLALTLTAIGAAAVALVNHFTKAKRAKEEFFRESEKLAFKEAEESAEALARGTERAAQNAERWARAQANVSDELDASLRKTERINRAADRIDDIETPRAIQELDARTDLTEGQKGIARARIEDAARRRRFARDAAREDAGVARLDRASARERGTAAGISGEIERLQGEVLNDPAELVAALDAAIEKVRPRIQEIEEFAKRGREVLGEDAEFEKEVKLAQLRAQTPQREAAERLLQAREDRRAEIEPEIARLRGERAAAIRRAEDAERDARQARQEIGAARPVERAALERESALRSRGAQLGVNREAATLVNEARGVVEAAEGRGIADVADALRGVNSALRNRGNAEAAAVADLKRQVDELREQIENTREPGL